MTYDKISILVVEDAITEQQALKREFTERGFRVFCASNGQEAIRLAESEKPNVVIIDTILPGMNGFKVCEMIKAIDGLNTKVIVNTGNINAVDAGRAMKMGADDYYVKTSDFNELITAVNRFVDH